LTQYILPPGGKCLGLQTSPTYRKFIQMSDDFMILNTHWTENTFTISANVSYAGSPYVGSTDQTPRPGSDKPERMNHIVMRCQLTMMDIVGNVRDPTIYCDQIDPSELV
jgi:hypothetical protein